MKSFPTTKDVSSNPAPSEVYNWRIYALAISAAMGSAMFGYDSAFIGGAMSLPSFKTRFHLASAAGHELAALKANIVSTFQAGCFFGVIFCYFATERIGRRWPLIICGFIFNIGVILQLVSAGSVGLIYGGRALTGKLILRIRCRRVTNVSKGLLLELRP
jgi:MFS family permease